MLRFGLLLAVVLIAVILVAIEIGRRLGEANSLHRGAKIGQGTGAVEGAVFAVFGLLLAFTFSGAASRFEHRRDLIVQEANAIGTAYLRLELLDGAAQEKLRPLFREYVSSRLAAYQMLPTDQAGFQTGMAASVALQNEIWQTSVAATQRAHSPAVMSLVLTPINEMIDTTTTRMAALRTHPPSVIYALLIAFSIASALIAGYGMSVSRQRQWLHMLMFAICMAGTIYVIVDLEYPRVGLIRADDIDLHLEEVLSSMTPRPALK